MISTGRVFISYRREETRHIAGRLADRLATRLGDNHVFMDVDTIAPGADYFIAIDKAVGSCDALLALIGPHWFTLTDSQGRRRLENSSDFVVQEISTALRRKILVIPVLVDGAEMPEFSEFPSAVQGLARRNAVRLDHETFSSDVQRILKAVEQALNVTASSRRLNWKRSEQPEPTVQFPAVAHQADASRPRSVKSYSAKPDEDDITRSPLQPAVQVTNTELRRVDVTNRWSALRVCLWWLAFAYAPIVGGCIALTTHTTPDLIAGAIFAIVVLSGIMAALLVTIWRIARKQRRVVQALEEPLQDVNPAHVRAIDQRRLLTLYTCLAIEAVIFFILFFISYNSR